MPASATLATAIAALASLVVLAAPTPIAPEPHLDLRALAHGPCPLRLTSFRGAPALALCNLMRPTSEDRFYQDAEAILGRNLASKLLVDAAPDTPWRDVGPLLPIASGGIYFRNLGIGSPGSADRLWIDVGEGLPAPECVQLSVILGADERVRLAWATVYDVRRPSLRVVKREQLPQTLASLPINHCLAHVEAAPNTPWRDVRPIFEALQTVGYRHF